MLSRLSSYDRGYAQFDEVAYDRPRRNRQITSPKLIVPRQNRGRGKASTPWVHKAMSALVASRSIALATCDGKTPPELIIVNGSVTKHGYGTLQALKSACDVAALGDQRKTPILVGNLDNTPSSAVNGTAAAGINVWGWRVRVSGSANGFTHRAVLFATGPTTNGSGAMTIAAATRVLDFVLYPTNKVTDLLILNVANAGTVGAVQNGVHNQLIANNTATTLNALTFEDVGDSNITVSIEPLNARDWMLRDTNAAGPCQDAEEFDDSEFSVVR